MGLRHPPRSVRKDDELSLVEILDYGMAARSWRWHWLRWKEGRGYKPHAMQRRFHESKAKLRGFIGGVGSGKTAAGAAEVARSLIEEPGIVWIASAPTYKMLDQSTKVELFDFVQPQAIHAYSAQKNLLELTNGSKVWFRSTDDPETIRGITAARCWYDEAGYGTKKSFNVLLGRLRQIGYEHGFIITTTPRGFNWLFETFAGANKNPESFWVQVSSYDNPFTDDGFKATLEASYSGVFKQQELYGKFVGFEGLVYPQFDRNKHVGQYREWLKDGRFVEMRYWHDWGYTNPMVVLVAGIDTDGRVYIIDEWYERGRIIEDVVEVCKRFDLEYGEGMHVGDPAEPGFIDVLNNHNMPTIRGKNELLPGISAVANCLESQDDGRPRLFVDERCVHTINEFQMYRFEDEEEGRPVKDKPLKIHDHAMDALRYGIMDLGATYYGIAPAFLDAII